MMEGSIFLNRKKRENPYQKREEKREGGFSATAASASSLVDTKMRSGRGEAHMCIRECEECSIPT